MRALLLCGLLVGITGCGSGATGEPTVEVSGTVTYDGDPVPEGDIVFRDAAGEGRSYAGKIEGGRFAFESSPGPKTVEITARREVPGKFSEANPGEKVPITEQYLPPKYNDETTLERTVEKSQRKFEFELQGGQ